MADDPLRGIIARSFAILAAAAGAEDDEGQIETAAKFEHFIMTGEYPPEVFDSSTAAMLSGCVMKARAARQAKKG